jgi:hypothetical protein
MALPLASGERWTSVMPVSLDVSEAGDVAVLHGLASDAAVEHLCRSLTTGSVLEAYRALVIDIHDADPIDLPLQRALDEASDACLHRRQWLGVVRPGGALSATLRGARAWAATVDEGRPHRVGPAVVRDVARLFGGLVVPPMASATRRLLGGGPRRNATRRPR